MHTLPEHRGHCPYCGEIICLLIDSSGGSQTYIEDCQVCCRPIQVRIYATDDGALQAVELFSETDVN